MARLKKRSALLALAALVLALTGVVTTLERPINPSDLPSGLAVLMNAESTALYCTGLTSGSGSPGRVVFYNTAGSSRSLSVNVVSASGQVYAKTVELAARTSQFLVPSQDVKGSNFAVAVQISGGGVVAEEVSGTGRADVPCSSQGVTSWYGGGFDTLVGSSAWLSVYNPTATAAVFNTSLFSAAGLTQPQSLQGYSVPAHSVTEISLARSVVNTSNVGVAVTVSRGSLVIVGVQDSRGTISFDQGARAAATESWFSDVTTAASALAQIRVTNPNDVPTSVTVSLTLGHYAIPAQTINVNAYSTGLVSVTPNPAIPAAGYAAVTVASREPVVSTLATGVAPTIELISYEAPATAFLIRNFTGRGFDAASVTNTTSGTITVSVTSLTDGAPHSSTVVGDVKVAARGTLDLASVVPSLRRATNETYIVASSREDMVVSLTLPSHPAGVDVMAPLDGR